MLPVGQNDVLPAATAHLASSDAGSLNLMVFYGSKPGTQYS